MRRLAGCGLRRLRGFEVAAVELRGSRSRDRALDGDAVIDFEITANRPDCLSVVGLAREVATAYDLPLRAALAEPGATVGARRRADRRVRRG